MPVEPTAYTNDPSARLSLASTACQSWATFDFLSVPILFIFGRIIRIFLSTADYGTKIRLLKDERLSDFCV
jgi:hypothetical protein